MRYGTAVTMTTMTIGTVAMIISCWTCSAAKGNTNSTPYTGASPPTRYPPKACPTRRKPWTTPLLMKVFTVKSTRMPRKEDTEALLSSPDTYYPLVRDQMWYEARHIGNHKYPETKRAMARIALYMLTLSEMYPEGHGRT